MEEKIPQLLVDDEFRVRGLVGSLIKAIFETDIEGRAQVNFEKLKDLLVQSIEKMFERDQEQSLT